MENLRLKYNYLIIVFVLVPSELSSILQGVIYSLLSKDELEISTIMMDIIMIKKHLNVLHLVNYLENIKIENKHLIFDDDFYFYISFSLDENF